MCLIHRNLITMETNATQVSAPAKCWNCGEDPGAGHFCAACGKIQPVARAADYFAFFGLPRKLTIDSDELERRFHLASWKLHPDNFVRTTDFERELSLERSSKLNDAFRALREPVSRVEYLLASAGMRSEGQHKQQAPPELLEEVFELNESLDELRESRQAGDEPSQMAALGRKLAAARENFEAKLGEVDGELEESFAEWDRATPAQTNGSTYTPEQRKLMQRMNEILNRRSYIRNLVQSVQKELAEA